ncbi:AAA family ATPase [Thiomicrospira microaerophila]|uniref:AAA family ATPase n=1 Tax=Thiomicrospira microaerophila TaxID=406020 RepID=UPI0005C91F8B|nr:AAA family ATPase [Thiomicrospira microaerophila]
MSCKIITVFNQKGGVGKTTLSVNLSYEAELRGLTTLLINIDPQGSAISWIANAPDENPFPAAIIDLSALGTKVRLEIEKHFNNYDLIIIDCPPNKEQKTAQAALMVSDIVVIPVDPTPMSLVASDQALQLIDEVKVYNDDLKTLIMASKMERTNLAKGVLSALHQTQGATTMKSCTTNLVAYAEAFFYGTGVSAVPGATKASDEIKSVTDEIFSHLENLSPGKIY